LTRDHDAEAYDLTDGAQSLYCHGTSRATELAGEAEKLERGDGQVGVVYCGGMIFFGSLVLYCRIADGDCSGQSTLKFINDDASSVHGAVRASSVFTSESGEWKLGGFDILSSMKEDDAIIYVSYPGSCYPGTT
jgi:hypothetical protein